MTERPKTDAWLAFEDGQHGPFVIAAEEIESCVKLAQDLGRLPSDEDKVPSTRN